MQTQFYAGWCSSTQRPLRELTDPSRKIKKNVYSRKDERIYVWMICSKEKKILFFIFILDTYLKCNLFSEFTITPEIYIFYYFENFS